MPVFTEISHPTEVRAEARRSSDICGRRNDKKKGRGNKSLSWAFAEASKLALRDDPLVRAWHNRKAAKTNMMIARSALAHKLARAAYHMMKEEAPLDQKRLFGYSVGPGGETDKGVGKTTGFD